MPGHAQTLGPSWAVTGATLIDGTGAAPLPAAVIVGRDSRIECAGQPTHCPIPNDAVVLDMRKTWIIPGLIDTHVHLNWSRGGGAEERQRIRLAFGITATREAGTAQQLDANLHARDRASLPRAPEPRLVVSAWLSKENAERFGTQNVAELVRKLAGTGADAIKVKQAYSLEDFRAIVEAAHEHALPVFGHTWDENRSALEAALQAGVDGLSHMATFSMFGERTDVPRQSGAAGAEYWVSNKERWNRQDDVRLVATIDKAIAGHVWFEPILVSEKYFTLPYPLPDDLDYLAGTASLRQQVRQWLPFGDTGWPARRNRRERLAVTFRHMCEFVRRFHERGGIVVAGTDDVQPGIALVDEIRLLADCGLSPMAALDAATRQAAIALGLRDGGTVEAGKMADFVILESDPLRDLAELRRVKRVVKGGYQYDPATLLRPEVEALETARKRRWAWVAAGLILSLVATVSVGRVVLRRRRGYGS